MNNPLPTPPFDFNILNRLFDILELTTEDKKELAQEIVEAVTHKVIVNANFDIARINEFGQAGQYRELADYLSSQVTNPAEFMGMFETEMADLVSALIDEFEAMATPEQQQVLQAYLAEYQDQFARLQTMAD